MADDLRELIRRKAEQYQVDPAVIQAIIAAESTGVPTARSPKGAMGLMQLMPATAGDYGVRPEELFDPERNLDAGIPHLKKLQQLFPDNPDLQYAAWNAGQGNVAKYGGIPPFPETQAFVQRVKRNLSQGQMAPAAAPGASSWATGTPEKTTARLLQIWSGEDPDYAVPPTMAPALQDLAAEVGEIPPEYADVRATTLYARLSEVLDDEAIAKQIDPTFRASLQATRDLLWKEMGGSNLAKGQVNLGGLLRSAGRGLTAAIDPFQTSASRVDYPTEAGWRGGLSGLGSLAGYVAGGFAPIVAGMAGGPLGLAAGGAYAAGTQELNRQAIQDRETAALRAALAQPDSLTRQRYSGAGINPDEMFKRRTAGQAMAGVAGQSLIGGVAAPLAFLRIPQKLWPLASRLSGLPIKAAPAAIKQLPYRQALKGALPIEGAQLLANVGDMAASVGLMKATDPQLQQISPSQIMEGSPEVAAMPFGITALQLLAPRGSLAHAARAAAAGAVKPSQYPTQPRPTPAPTAQARPQPANQPPVSSPPTLKFRRYETLGDINDLLEKQIPTDAKVEEVMRGMRDRGPQRLVHVSSEYYQPGMQYYGRIPDEIPDALLPPNVGRHFFAMEDPASPGHGLPMLINDSEFAKMRMWVPWDAQKNEWLVTEPGDYLPSPLTRFKNRETVKVPLPGHPDAFAVGTTANGRVIVFYKNAAGQLVRDELDPLAAPSYGQWADQWEKKREQAQKHVKSTATKVVRQPADIPVMGKARPPITVTPPKGWPSPPANPPPAPPSVGASAPPPKSKRKRFKKPMKYTDKAPTQLSLPELFDAVLKTKRRTR